MPYLDPRSLTLERNARRLTVRSPFWSVSHDLDRGGTPVDIRFVHGDEGNILRQPLSAHVDLGSDVSCPATSVRTRRLDDGSELTFSGSMADSGSFRTAYRYTPYFIRRELTLNFPAGARPRRVTPISARFDGRFTHWGAAHDPQTKPGRVASVMGAHYDQDDAAIPSKPGIFFRDRRAPGWMNLFRLGGEGISIAPTGDLSAWGDGDYRLARDRQGLTLQCDVWPRSPTRQLAFASYITLPNLPAMRPAPWRTTMVGNPPFPDDKLLRAWAQSGVELIVIMGGASWVGSSDRYWRIGMYPPYHDRRDMRDLDRLIRSVHRFGMRIVPATCPSYLHPEVPEFHRHVQEWYQMPIPGGQIIYHPAGKGGAGGLYGALMCFDSASWRDYNLRYVEALLTKHDFDGVYLDCIWKAPCYNPAHGSSHHGGLDGAWKLVGDVRRLLGPDRLTIIHNGEFHFQAVSNNFADMIVTLEGIPLMKNFRYDLAAIARPLRSFPATRVCAVPRSVWYRIPPPMPKRMGLYDGIAKTLLLGTVPYSYAMWETRWGYKDHWDCLRDPRGIYAAFRELKSLKLDAFDVVNARVRPHGVRGVCYRGKNREVLLVANVSDRRKRNIRWRYRGKKGVIPSLDADEYRFVELRPQAGIGWKSERAFATNDTH